jgi:aminopeptidase
LPDPRVEAYARLLVERCLDVQPGWQVLIRSTPLARPALEALQRHIARRGAYAVLRVGYAMWPLDFAWAEEASDELLAELSEIDRFACDHMDARITMEAPENTREGSDLSPARLSLAKGAERYFFRRSMSDEIPWVACLYPTQALAQEAGLTLEEFENAVYAACLVDWDAEGQRLQRYVEQFDAAEELRILGPGTELTMSLAGRRGEVDAGRTNMPGGEIFFSPVEDSAEGVIEFSEFPSVYQGHEFTEIRLAFREGRVVEASAAKGEDVLVSILDRDEGARAIGELGIGCNRGIQRHLKNTLFDEKIDGSVHLALGQSYPKVGGTNVSSVHWDIVKDLRGGGRLELDGRLVQEGGRWLI